LPGEIESWVVVASVKYQNTCGVISALFKTMHRNF